MCGGKGTRGNRALAHRVDRRSLLKGAVAVGALSVVGGSVAREVKAQDASGGTQAATWEAADQASTFAAAARSTSTYQTFDANFTFYAIAPHWAAEGDPDAQVEIQLSSDGSSWSDPVTIGVDNTDAGQPDREDRHFGELLFTQDGASSVRYRTLDSNGNPTTLPGMAFTYIDATSGPSINDVGPAADSPSVQIPPIISRADWGADESYRFDSDGNDLWPPEYQTVEHVIIHHSDTPNFEDPMVTVRSIYYYHAITRGWGDIGYNYLVDYLGHIYEGRYGGENVIGGHAFQYAHGSSGICTMGTFMDVDETPEAQTGLIWITAWAGRYLDPLGSADFHEQPNLPTICGHRDVLPTDCPGDQVWYDLPYIRNRVNDILNNNANPAPNPDMKPGDQVQVTVDGGNLRSGPGTSFSVLAAMGVGTPLTVIDGPATNGGYTWYEVTGDPGTGWAATIIIEKTASGGPRFSNGDTVVVNEDGINLRNAPGLDGSVLGTISQGTTGTVISGPEVSGGYVWYKISFPHNTGWMADAFLDGNGSTPPPTNGEFQPGDTVSVNTDVLNLRSSPNTSASVVGQMPYGTVLTVTDGPQSAGGYTWYKVNGPYGTGWCAGDYLARASSPPSGGFNIGDSVVVDTDILNLRSSPSTSGSVIGQMPNGTKLQITDGPQSADGYTWYKVSGSYGNGWCASDYLAKSSSGGGLHPGGAAQVFDGNLNMRSGAGLSSGVIAVLPDGTRVDILSEPTSADGYNWYQVKNSSYGTGWCASDFLQPL